MIYKDIKLFSQNVQKNSLIIKTILEVKTNFDIIFIQEPFWTTIHSILCSSNCKVESLVSVVNHPNWLIFTRPYTNEHKYPRVIIYIKIRLFSFHFSLWKDIIDHRNIILVLFFNNSNYFWLMNVYPDSLHTTLKYLKNIKVNIHNLLVITRDFNIWDNLLDLSFPHHSSISDNLIIIVVSFNLNLLCPINQVPTRYFDNNNDSNSVIDLMFLWCSSTELNNYLIHSNWHLPFDHIFVSHHPYC